MSLREKTPSTADPTSQTQPRAGLTFKEKLGYGLGDTASHFVWDMVGFWLLFFYIDVYRIPAAAAGMIMLVARFWDMGIDPIVGIVSDRTQTRWGKFRPYILFGAVPYAFHAATRDPMVGILLRTRIGMDVYGTNTRIEKMELGDFEPGDELEVDFQVDCWLTPQQYTLTVATQGPDGSSHDWLDDTIAFDVVDTRVAAGVANLRAKVAWRVSR